jgi:hypothetical protein
VRRIPLLLVVLVAVAACSGGSAEPLGIRAIAAKVGCQSFKSDSQELYVAASGGCSGVPGVDEVATFNNNDARDSWLQAASAFGGVCVVGDRWVVCGPSRAAVEKVQARLGGEVRA